MSTASAVEHIRLESIPDVYVPRPVATAILSTHLQRITTLIREGKLRTAQCPGGHERVALRDVLAMLGS